MTIYYTEANLARSAREFSRLNNQHDAILRLMHNQPIHAPVDPAFAKVALEIGCGSGRMSLFMAEYFQNAIVYGVDISPVPTSMQAEAERIGRVHFIQGNIYEIACKHPNLQLESVDYIFHCLLAPAMESCFVYLRDIVAPFLKPGGWIEMHDSPCLDFYSSASGKTEMVSAHWRWSKQTRDQFELRGQGDRRSEPGFECIIPMLQILDYENVRQKLYEMPWGPVPGRPGRMPG